MVTSKYQEIKSILLKKKEEILSEKINLEALQGVRLPDEFDVASIDRDQSIQTNLLNRRSKYLVKINEALEKIANNEYGECEDCGCEIKFKRLLVQPTASYCIECKQAKEKFEKECKRRGLNSDEWSNDET